MPTNSSSQETMIIALQKYFASILTLPEHAETLSWIKKSIRLGQSVHSVNDNWRHFNKIANLSQFVATIACSQSLVLCMDWLKKWSKERQKDSGHVYKYAAVFSKFSNSPEQIIKFLMFPKACTLVVISIYNTNSYEKLLVHQLLDVVCGEMVGIIGANMLKMDGVKLTGRIELREPRTYWLLNSKRSSTFMVIQTVWDGQIYFQGTYEIHKKCLHYIDVNEYTYCKSGHMKMEGFHKSQKSTNITKETLEKLYVA